jgi:predicted dehydrogenase
VHTHFPLARAALEAGKHVLVEKPLTDSSASAQALVELADARGLVLQVDHTFVYTGAVRKVREIIERGELGELLYLDFVRVNLGLFQEDVNVLWDLGPHDVSILAHWVDRKPLWVSAVGSAHYGELEDQVYVTVKFEGSLIAHLHLNWLAPVKVRSTLIGGTRRMIVYDDLEPSEKVRVYEKGVTLVSDARARARALVDYRVGDMFAPYIDKTEPLALVCRAFRDAIENGVAPATSGRAGLAVVRILEAAQESVRKQGARVSLESSA